MKHPLLTQYARDLQKAKDLEERLSVMKAEILVMMGKAKQDKIETLTATFQVVNAPKYSYTEKVTLAEKKLALQREKERKLGLASKEDNLTLRVSLV